MKRRDFIESLFSELPVLEKSSVLDSETSARIREFYSSELTTSASGVLKRVQLFLAILSCALISGGFLLVIGHNWDIFSGFTRIAFVTVPLVFSMLFGGWVLLCEKGTAYRESASILISLLTLTAIALVSQQYHSTGTVADLGFAWMLVTIPLMYILRANSLSVLVVSGGLCILFGNNFNSAFNGTFYRLCVIGAASFPYFVYALVKTRSGALAYLIQSVIVMLSGMIFAASFINVENYDVVFALPVFVSAFYTLGVWYGRYQKRNAFLHLGGAACIIYLFLFSYEFFWKEFGYIGLITNSMRNAHSLEVFTYHFMFFALIYVAVVAAMVHFSKEIAPKIAIAIPFLAVFSMWFEPSVMMVITNILIIAYGIAQFVHGLVSRSLWRVNYGMAVITLTAFLRFLDWDKDILLYAFFFIGAGVIFLAVNIFVSRMIRKEAVK